MPQEVKHAEAGREPFDTGEFGQVVHLDTTAEDANQTLVALLRERLKLV